MLAIALILTGVLAAHILPRGKTAEKFEPWTEEDFDIVWQRELAKK